MRGFCLCLLILLGGCHQPQVLTYTPKTLDTAGPISIDVSSFAGNVTIIADDTALATTIEVTQRDDGYSELELPPLVQWNAWKENGDLGQLVLVEATTEDDSLQTLHADILVRAQSIHGIRIRTSRGDVSVYGISGAVDIRTSDGDVRLATPLVMNDEVTIENIRGDINMRIRGESSGTIDATAMNGSAAVDVRHGDVIILPKTTGDHVMAQLNSGANQYIFRTVDGNVKLAVVENPIADEPWFSFEWLSW